VVADRVEGEQLGVIFLVGSLELLHALFVGFVSIEIDVVPGGHVMKMTAAPRVLLSRTGREEQK